MDWTPKPEACQNPGIVSECKIKRGKTQCVHNPNCQLKIFTPSRLTDSHPPPKCFVRIATIHTPIPIHDPPPLSLRRAPLTGTGGCDGAEPRGRRRGGLRRGPPGVDVGGEGLTLPLPGLRWSGVPQFRTAAVIQLPAHSDFLRPR